MVDWTSQLMQFVQAAIMLGLAGVLLALTPHRRAARVFAWILVLRSALATTYSLGLIASDAQAAQFWWNLRPIPFFFLPFAVLHFILVFPKPRGALGRSRWAGPAFLAPGALLTFVYWLDPSTFWDLEGYVDGGLGPEADAPAGPLFVFDVLFEATYGLAALMFARDFVADPAESHRLSLLLVSLGFAFVVLFDAVSLPLVASDLLRRHAFPLEAALVGSLVIAVALVAASAALMARAGLLARSAKQRGPAVAYVALLPLPVLSAMLLWTLPTFLDSVPITQRGLYYLFGGLWRLALPLFVAYALLRHHIFGIDLGIRWTIRRGPVAIVLLALVIGVTEVTVNALNNVPGGLAVGGLVAAMGFLLLRPIQRLADRFTDAAMPRVRETEEYRTYRRFEIYRAALESALGDDDVTERERRVLLTLRSELGISEQDAAALERDLRTRRYGSPGAGTG